ncbi:unnamed protein product [Triticum turgidum subsp. durum]|uniref:Uncharacterized protein n=1 Tax=Triticum turgidum subsp. durum TaxID=4567 RepID=A0A9R0QDR3_TRITD|nr:unnamed protein product [Triticum turgidum subsp. durum]
MATDGGGRCADNDLSFVESGARSALRHSPTALPRSPTAPMLAFLAVVDISPAAERSSTSKVAASSSPPPTTFFHGRQHHWPSLDDDEPWEVRFHFQGCDNLERRLYQSDITCLNMLAIIGMQGYDQSDSMYYVKEDGVGMSGMQLIRSDEDVEEMLELYEDKMCVTITVMKGREIERAELQINIGDEQQIPISQIGSPKIYNVDEEGVLYASQANKKAEQAACFAPIVSVHTEDSCGEYLITQESCNVRKGATIADLDDFLNEFADILEVQEHNMEEDNMEDEENMEEEDLMDSDSCEDEQEDEDADIHVKIKDLKRKRVFEGDSEPEDLFCEADEEEEGFEVKGKEEEGQEMV